MALAFLVTAVLVAADYEVVKRTMLDTTYFGRLAPPFVIAWFIAWAYPQFVALATPVVGLVERVYSRKKPSAEESDEPYPAIKGLP